MATTADVAEAIRKSFARMHTIWVQNGWNQSMPFNQLFGWNAPPYPLAILATEVERIAHRVKTINGVYLADPVFKSNIDPFIVAFDGVNFSNLTSDYDAVIGGYVSLLMMTDNWVPNPVPPKPKVDWEEIKDSKLLPSDLRSRLRRIEANLTDFEPRADEIGRKIAEVDAAHDAAEQLPKDLAELAKHRTEVKASAEAVAKQALSIENAEAAAKEAISRIDLNERETERLINKADEAYRVATSAGLAGAFQERATSLNFTGWVWVGALVVALLSALGIGADRVTALKDVLTGDKSAAVVWVNALLAVAGLGAPIWLAWLSTRQIGQSFRLAEDYAYKASVAKAYEGYRREAVTLDPALANRLFGSALTRLEEAPIRLIEGEQHNTPVQEFLSSPYVSALLASVPELKDKLVALVPGKGQIAAVAVAPIVAMADAASTPNKKPSAEPEEG